MPDWNNSMKQTVLARYEKTVNGNVIMDVTTSQVEELYENYDRSAPYIRRDLDRDLVEYLIECAKEVRPEPFVIRFTFNQPAKKDEQSRIYESVNAYFLYLAESEGEKIRQMFRRCAILFSIGLVILFLSVSLNQTLGEERSVVANVFAEGLTIAAWVSLWESLAILLLEWFPYRKNIRLYCHLANAELIFRPEPMDQNDTNKEDKNDHR